MTPVPGVALIGRTDGLGGDPEEIVFWKPVVHWLKAIFGNGLSEMGMIEHEEVVAGSKISNRMRFKAFERLPRPLEDRRRVARRSRLERAVAARVVPGQTLKNRLAHGASDPRQRAGAVVSVAMRVMCQRPRLAVNKLVPSNAMFVGWARRWAVGSSI